MSRAADLATENADSPARRRAGRRSPSVGLKSPIGSLQAVQQHGADMAVHVLTARLLANEAAWRLSHDFPATPEVSPAKACASEQYQEVCALAHQVHGASGSPPNTACTSSPATPRPPPWPSATPTTIPPKRPRPWASSPNPSAVRPRLKTPTLSDYSAKQTGS
ncbi:hypothetical protein GTY73_12165 [Streptomyces sp. SID8354]|nr:hypothetical protein [Streptomyces sp. SID8354]